MRGIGSRMQSTCLSCCQHHASTTKVFVDFWTVGTRCVIAHAYATLSGRRRKVKVSKQMLSRRWPRAIQGQQSLHSLRSCWRARRRIIDRAKHARRNDRLAVDEDGLATGLDQHFSERAFPHEALKSSLGSPALGCAPGKTRRRCSGDNDGATVFMATRAV